MKKKEVFKRVAKHLLAQNEACVTLSVHCWYRHPSRVELKCAIGCLISDEFYSEEIENNEDLTESLKKLNELYKSGAITKEEFKKAKEKILN